MISILVFWVLAGIALAQAAPNPQDEIRIRRLTIESSSLPDADREQVARQFEGKDACCI
ncbi:MAG: hypothetical protein ACHP7P_05755 [Terriglobales bacterium]